MNICVLVGNILLGIGMFLTITTMLGFARFDDVYTRIHISSINDMLGIPVAIIGTSFLFFGLGDIFTAIKLCLGAIIWYIVTPITSYFLIKIVYFYKENENNKN